jgi:hypothetical protein
MGMIATSNFLWLLRSGFCDPENIIETGRTSLTSITWIKLTRTKRYVQPSFARATQGSACATALYLEVALFATALRNLRKNPNSVPEERNLEIFRRVRAA